MKNRILFLILIIFTISGYTQKLININESDFLTLPDRIIDDSDKRQCQSAVIEWEQNLNSKNSSCLLKFTSPVDFTCLGLGLAPDQLFSGVKPIDFIITYRVSENNNNWSNWKTADVETTPAETNTGMFWTELIFTPDGAVRNKIEIQISLTKNTPIDKIRIDLMNISSSVKNYEPIQKNGAKPNGCPPFPTIIERTVWLHPYYGTQSYTPSTIYPTHVVVHHGASPDTYADGETVVRGYWNYHVNTLGWSDIGYNYLFDKYGNIYQGRKNSDMQGQDVRGAHAGASNDESIGVNFLGNADITTPTTVQLNSLHAFLGWWFDTRAYDPTTSAPITMQSGGSGTLPRIMGHKDTNVGGTACPGTVLYGYLASIRTNTKAVIDACVSQPVTSVSVTGNWQTTDFIASFTDTADMGLNIPFYQALDWNGTEWRANADSGFFNDNFDNTLHTDWTSISGSWSINGSYLYQSNEDSINTNIYSPVAQTAGNIYLYHFSMKMGGIGTNRRAGIHFFCDDATMTQRNNSYMVYFRVDQDKCQIYKAENDNITLYTDDNCTIDPDTWYDYKIILNTVTGDIFAYKDDVLISSWTDATPFSAANSISMRTGNCNAFINDLKVYRHRSNIENISVGSNGLARYENTNLSTPSCRVKSIIVDDFNNWSALEGTDVNIDWTPPSAVTVYDGSSADIDTIFDNTQITANWTNSADINSNVIAYWYCVGDAPGNNNIIDWTNNGLNTIVTRTGLTLEYDSSYYFTVKSENGAGLFSLTDTSDGQFLSNGTIFSPTASFYAMDTLLYMPTASAIFINNSIGANNYTWDFGDGTTSNDQNPWHQYDTTGYYTVQLIAHSSTAPDDTLSLTDYIHVVNPTAHDLNKQKDFSIYPNPFNDKLFVELKGDQKISSIKLINIIGKQIDVSHSLIEQGKIYLNIDNCHAGIYNLILQTNITQYSVTLIKQ